MKLLTLLAIVGTALALGGCDPAPPTDAANSEPTVNVPSKATPAPTSDAPATNAANATTR